MDVYIDNGSSCIAKCGCSSRILLVDGYCNGSWTGQDSIERRLFARFHSRQWKPMVWEAGGVSAKNRRLSSAAIDCGVWMRLFTDFLG
jgi:hypothetical protein